MLAAISPAVLAGLGVGLVAVASQASPTVLSDFWPGQRAPSHGDLSRIIADMDPSQRAIAARHDPSMIQPALYGLTPGWETLSLGGKPSLDSGATGLEAQRLNAAMPVSVGAVVAAGPFVIKSATTADARRAERCLTQAIYYEAALESTEGQQAVAQVVLNRVRDLNYPASICGVVFQGAERTTGCQFSFTCDGALAQTPVAWAWDRARTVAKAALSGHVAASVGTATHYHADYVHPWWAPSVAKVTQIGAHIFYRWKGLSGQTAAFRQAYATREPVIDEARFSKPRLILASDDRIDALDEMPTDQLKTVQIDGQTRVVGVPTLGGRRIPTAQEVEAINSRIRDFEARASSPVPSPPKVTLATPGAVLMAVEEVGRAQN